MKTGARGIGEYRFEPADCAGAHTRQYGSRLPRTTQDLGHVPVTPDREHALGIAAANVDHILFEQHCLQIRRARKEWHVSRPARKLSEGGVERVDIGLCIT